MEKHWVFTRETLWSACSNLVFNHCKFSGLTRYLNMVFQVDMPPSQYGHCSITSFGVAFGSLPSTLFITNMTFQRLYSIIRPHKAASFNTVKRAKITIACILIFSLLFNFPHFFISSNTGRVCITYGTAIRSMYGQVYYWFGFILSYSLPFISLLLMNTVIIHTLWTRSIKTIRRSGGQGQLEGEGRPQGQSMKSSERQITITLLLVTFVFLILVTPVCIMVLYAKYADVRKSAYSFAGYYLFYNVAIKAYYTNHGINFFLYVISGQKFRADLINFFSCLKRSEEDIWMVSNSNSNTKVSSVYSIQKDDNLSEGMLDPN